MSEAPAPIPRLDDLQYKGLKLYQQPGYPCFTQDTVLLADFAALHPEDIAADIGSGTGALAILSNARTGAHFACIEKAPVLCALLRSSIAYNRLEQFIEVHALDWADAPAALGHGAFSAVLCNPPYFGGRQGSPSPARALARTGEAAPLQGAVACAAKLLKNGGRLFLCYPARQLTEVLYTLHDAGLEPKRLRLVAQTAQAAPYLALLECKKGGKPGILMEPLLCLRDAVGQETEEYKRIYHMEEKPSG